MDIKKEMTFLLAYIIGRKFKINEKFAFLSFERLSIINKGTTLNVNL